MIKLLYTQHSSCFTLKIENIIELSVATLKQLEEFAENRNGRVDYNKEEIYVPKNLTLHELKKLFTELSLEVFITIYEPTRVKLADEAVIGFGKFKGTRWRDLDENYLQWLKNNLTGVDKSSAMYEIVRRKNSFEAPKELKQIIGFGKYRGQEWGSLPADYLKWVSMNLQGEAKRSAELVLAYKGLNI